MFFGVLASLFYSLCDVFYKKALQHSRRYITDGVYQFIGYAYLGILLLIAVISIEGELALINYIIFGLLFFNSIFNVVCEYLEQFAYRGEKISVLTPYGEFETIFATILGFLIFSDNTLITFVSALVAGIVLIAGSVKIEHLKMNKYCLAMMLSGFLTSMRYIIFGFVLYEFSELTSLFYSIAITFLIITGIVLFKKEQHLIIKSPWKLNKLIFTEGTFRILANLITLYLIKNVGIVEAVLVSMVYLFFNLLFAYMMFRDKPTIKEIITIVIVFACIVFGVGA